MPALKCRLHVLYVNEEIGFRTATTLEPTAKPGGRPIGAGKAKSAIERTFSPEFRNRLDAWIQFNQLSLADVERVVDKFINELRVQLEEQNVAIQLTEAARHWLARQGFDRLYGARPMARVIQQKVKEPLAEEILFGTLQDGGGTRRFEAASYAEAIFRRTSSLPGSARNTREKGNPGAAMVVGLSDGDR